MGYTYTVTVGYGFFYPGEDGEDLVERLGQGDYEVDDPDRALLAKLGYSGIEIIENHSDEKPGGWAVCAIEGYRSIEPIYNSGIWMLETESIPDEALASLRVLRDELFPLVEGGTVTRPRIGWFLMSSIW